METLISGRNFEWDDEKAELNKKRQESTRLISAREANAKERRKYYGNNSALFFT